MNLPSSLSFLRASGRITRWLALAMIGLTATISVRAQSADESTGVSINFKLFNLSWNSSDPDQATPSLYATFSGINGTQSTDTVYNTGTATNQISGRLAVGQDYYLYISATDVAGGSLLAAAPAGYVMEIEGVARDRYDFSGTIGSIKVRVRPPVGAAPGRTGVATALQTERTLWQVSLGNLSNGESAGAIAFIDTGAAASATDVATIFTPAGLVYDNVSSEVQVLLNSSGAAAPYVPGTFRQIIAPQVCVDVFMNNTAQCQLKFYHRAQLGAADSSGLYSFNGDPFAWYQFNPNGPVTNEVTVSCDVRDLTDSSGNLITAAGQPMVRTKYTKLTRSGTYPNYTWTADDWYDTGATALVRETRARSGSSETLTTAVPGQSSAVTLGRTYSDQAWGSVVTAETLGTSNPIVTSYDYSSSSDSQSAAYSRLRSKTSGGQWEAYEYYDYSDSGGIPMAGALKRLHHPFAANATIIPDLSSNSEEVTTYSYVLDPYNRATRPSQIATAINGTTVGNSIISYSSGTQLSSSHPNLYVVTATRQDQSDGGASLTSITKFFREDAGDTTRFSNALGDDFFRGRVHSVQRPDGVKQSFAYQRGTWNGSSFSLGGNSGLDFSSSNFASAITVITGTANSPAAGGTYYSSHNGYPIDPLYLVVDTAESGVTKNKSTMQVTIRDNYARVVRAEQHVWGNGGWNLVSATNYVWNYSNQPTKRAVNQNTTGFDPDSGALDDFTYQGERLAAQTDPTGVAVSYHYDMSDRIDTATRAGGGSIGSLVTTFAYDAAGHVTSQIRGGSISSTRDYDDAGRVVHDYAPGPNGAMATTYAYDPANRTVTVTLPTGGTRTETYQPNNAPSSVTGTAVVAQYFSYDIQGGGVKHARVDLGASSSARYREAWSDWLGRATQISQPGFTGQPTVTEQNTYDSGNGRLTRTTRTGYADTRYQYDDLGQPVASGLDLNASGALETGSTDRMAGGDRYVWQDAGGAWWLTKSSKTYPTNNSSTALTATTRQRLTGFTGNVRAETIATDVDGNVTDRVVSVDRVNKIVTVSTTASGYSNTQTETITNGLTTSVTSFDGLTSNTTYDYLLRRSTQSDPRTGNTTTNYYSGSTFVASVQDPGSRMIATYTYDNAGRVIAVQDAAGHVTYTEYNTRDQVIHRWGDATYPVEYGYSSTYGERTSMSTFQGGSGWTNTSWPGSAGANTTTWSYDGPSGLLVSKTDAATKSVTYTYNLRGQTDTRRWARGTYTEYSYDSSTGELASQKYFSQYYGRDNPSNVADGTPSATYTYTRSGQIATVADVTGTRTFNYNGTDPLQLDSITLPGYYGSRTLTRQYDSIHRPDGFAVGSELTQTYTYNGLGRFDHVDSVSSVQSSRTFAYGYNSGGLVASMGVGSSFGVSYDYDSTRDLVTKVDSLWGVTSRTRYDYTYNNLGQRDSAKQSGDVFGDFGGSTYYRYLYDGKGQLTDATDYLGEDQTSNASPQLSGRHHALTYDNIGNRLTASRTGTAGVADTFTLNAVNQYSNRTNPYANIAGTVASSSVNVTVSDPGGAWPVNRQGRYWAAQAGRQDGSGPTRLPLTLTGTLPNGAGTNIDLYYSDSSRAAYLAAKLQTFSYDDDGNMLTDGIWYYTYDAENRLTGMTTTGTAVSAGFPNRLLEFKYDYLGRRVQKRSTNTTAGTDVFRRYLYDGDNLVAEFDVNNPTSSPTCGSLLKSYTWGLDVAGSLTATGGVGALVQFTDHATSTSYFPTYDGNGNVASLLRASDGTAVAKYEYSPFGELLRCEFPSTLSTAELASVKAQPFKFSTKFTDDESGLVYYGARYYSPSLGRFVNRDPIAEAGGLNLYGFCGNDAINEYDYLGYSWLSKFWNKARHTIISVAIQVVGNIIVPGLGNVLSAAYNIGVGASYGGLKGALIAAGSSSININLPIGQNGVGISIYPGTYGAGRSGGGGGGSGGVGPGGARSPLVMNWGSDDDAYSGGSQPLSAWGWIVGMLIGDGFKKDHGIATDAGEDKLLAGSARAGLDKAGNVLEVAASAVEVLDKSVPPLAIALPVGQAVTGRDQIGRPASRVDAVVELGTGAVIGGVAKAAIRFHHPWPKYLGGKIQQILEPLPKDLHDAYHAGLDKYLSRSASDGVNRGTAFYENMTDAELRVAFQKLEAYTKDFDARKGTRLWEAMLREGFLSSP